MMKSLLKTALMTSALASLFLGRSLLADDYPQWRGKMRDGISQEKGLLKEWTKEGPKLVWQMQDAGGGFGTPAIVGGRIYLISNKGLDNEFVQALDAKDGKKIWSIPIGKVGNPNQQPSYPGARSTPTVDGNLLYAMSSDGDLVCLQIATGKMVWKKSLRTEFGGQPGIWAYSESPLIDGETVVCTPGGSQATVLALNKKTGAVIWKSAVPGADQAGYASIIIADIGGTKQYVQFLQKGLVGLDAKTGKFLWRYEGTAKNSAANIPTPVAYQGQVYSATGQGGSGLIRIKPGSNGYEAEQVYFARKLPNAIGGTVRIGDYLYGTGGQTLYCVDFKTGALKWEDRCVGAGSICYADGLLYIHGENGEIALVEATPTGYHEKGRFTPANQPERARTKAWAYPAISGGRLYIRDLNSLWCYDIKGK